MEQFREVTPGVWMNPNNIDAIKFDASSYSILVNMPSGEYKLPITSLTPHGRVMFSRMLSEVMA